MTQNSDGSAPIDILQGDPQNPRQIGDDAAHGLGVSMTTFGDIAGITHNRRTGQLVGGHQRVAQLREAGATKIVMIEPDLGYIEHPKTQQRFIVRFVDWDEPTQRLANLSANNPAIQGEFTRDAVDQLKALEQHTAFEALQLDALAKELEAELGRQSEPSDPDPRPSDGGGQGPESRARGGDVWLLGDHRLIIGKRELRYATSMIRHWEEATGRRAERVSMGGRAEAADPAATANGAA